MAKLLKLRRGTTSQHSSFTGAEGEVTVDTTKDTVVVHDGSTAGGVPLAKESAVTAIPAVIDEDNMSTNSATRPPSQQSVKAYVDALPDVIDEDNLGSDSATRPPSQQSVKAYVDALPDVIDEDNFASNSATRPPSQQSVKAYVDALPDVIDEDNFSTDSATRPPSQQSVKAYIQTVSNADAATYATINNSNLTGTATGVNLTLSGNLTVNGSTTTVATTNTTVSDNLLELNSGASSNANDAGILIERGSTGDNAIIAWDESADKFTVGTTTATNSATGNISITTGTLVANVEGNVTGNVTGSSGSCTGNAATATDSDTLDGIHGSSFLRSDGADTAAGDITFDGGAGAVTIGSSADIRLTSGNWTGNITTPKIQAHADYLYLCGGSNGIIFRENDSDRWQVDGSGHFLPGLDSTYNLGSSANRVSWGYFDNFNSTILQDGKGDVRSIPQLTKSSAHALVASDAGQCCFSSSGGFVINNSVMSSGDAVTLINNSGSDMTITQGSGVTLYNTGDASTGNRTLAGRGMATVWFSSASVAYISGSGLS